MTPSPNQAYMTLSTPYLHFIKNRMILDLEQSNFVSAHIAQ